MSEYTNKGHDRLGTKDDGLRYEWYNGRWKKEKAPCQISAVQLDYDVILEVISWSHTDNGEYIGKYESQVRILGEKTRTNHNDDQQLPSTRLEAQKEAEQMLVELRDELNNLLKDKEPRKKSGRIEYVAGRIGEPRIKVEEIKKEE